MINRKGISALVATVLLVLITIAAVGIIWGAVMPMIKGNIEKSQKCYDLALEIKQAGNTCYHLYDETLDVQVGRGEKVADLNDLAIQVGYQGTSKSVRISDSTLVIYNNGTIPGPNEDVKYTINVTALGLGGVDYATVAAVLKIGNVESVCSTATSQVAIDEC